MDISYNLCFHRIKVLEDKIVVSYNKHNPFIRIIIVNRTFVSSYIIATIKVHLSNNCFRNFNFYYIIYFDSLVINLLLKIVGFSFVDHFTLIIDLKLIIIEYFIKDFLELLITKYSIPIIH